MNRLLFYAYLYAWLYFSTFCHEIGHFAFAKLSGISPYLVQIGGGYKLGRLRLFNTTFEFGITPFEGLTHAYYSTLDSFNAKFIFYALGGAFANFSLLILTLIISKFIDNPILLVPICVEFMAVIINLIPMEAKVYGIKQPNDGKLIIMALFTDYKKIFENIFEEYNKALFKYEIDENSLPKTFLNNDLITLQIFLRAQDELNQENFEEAVKWFLEVLRFEKISNLEKAFILDHLACIVAISGYKKYLNDADIWSKEAITLASNSKTSQGTRGAILIELGRYDEGKKLLLPLTEPGNDAIDIAISSCYIAKADYFLGNTEKVKGWLLNAKEIGVADRVLERIEQEINCFV